MTAILKAKDVSVRIDGKALIDSVSIRIGSGESVALVGPNGAGKSTLLRTLSGEGSPTSGSIYLKGSSLRDYSPRSLASHRAMLSQSIAVAFPFTVADVVAMGAGERRDSEIDALVDAVLDEVDLGGFRDRAITTLSGGEQQRAHFARVLVQLGCGEAVNGPGLLLLDEPTASLDLRHQLDVIAAIRRRVDDGTTVVTVVHDLNLAVLMGQRVVVMNHGRIAADAPPDSSITESVLQSVFGIAEAVCKLPAPMTPFVLPYRARKITM